jgi:succinate dehydrogenase flavin-adding protein (antitoxin of CptAB toxin-antitoxin module)
MFNIEEYKRRYLSNIELDLLYSYLDIELENMNDEEKQIWLNILNKIDPDNEI